MIREIDADHEPTDLIRQPMKDYPRHDEVYRLIELLKTGPNPAGQVRAARALSDLGNPRAIRALVEILADPHADIRLHAFLARGMTQSHRSCTRQDHGLFFHVDGQACSLGSSLIIMIQELFGDNFDPYVGHEFKATSYAPWGESTNFHETPPRYIE